MSELTDALWDRAKVALRVARHCIPLSGDAAASRAYYAAFYAVSAQFALKRQTFTKHSAVEGAVHRDLVAAGLWTEQLGEDYSQLARFRNTADYGGRQRISTQDARDAVKAAAAILRAVADAHPDTLTGLEEA